MADDIQHQGVARVDATAAAVALIEALQLAHGPLMFHQSGGCCDGSAPMCYPRGEFRVGARDVYLGSVADTPFYISGPQFEVWQHTRLMLDVVVGRGSGFSLESPHGVRFLIRSRLFTEDEQAALRQAGPPPRGAVGD
ncbi:MAG: DUF779 domain-containing protein [Proteobacteria bacterium]|jgi:uncharacterized protein (DUF779 family)|nr:DUF779 domain-containing protein [Pseudomonadota bacterium]